MSDHGPNGSCRPTGQGHDDPHDAPRAGDRGLLLTLACKFEINPQRINVRISCDMVSVMRHSCAQIFTIPALGSFDQLFNKMISHS